ncbi:MAG: hypothetical protein WC538_13040 [Thermoanaerobaculia bacterium]
MSRKILLVSLFCVLAAAAQAQPVLTPLSQTNVACFGGSNGAASVNAATSGTAPYTYDWTPGTPTGDGTTSVTGLTAGSWTCTVTDAASVTASVTFNITQPAALVVTPSSQTNIACFGGSNGAASINTPTGGAGGYTYNWTPGNPTGDGTVSVTGLTAGTWTCTVTDANSCTATQTFNITQPTSLVVTPSSQTNIACFGGSSGAASINTPTGGAGGYTYNWTPGNPTGDGTVSVTGLTAGTWTCTVTDANACTKTQTFNVTQPAAIVVTPSSQTNISCFGGSNGAASINTPTGGAGGYTYNWTPGNPTGDGTVSVTGLTAGTWTCTVTDANSCTATQTFNVTQPAAIVVTPASQTNIACFGGSNGAASINTPTGGAGGYTYNWTPGNPTGDGTVSVTGLTAGTWTCTVTDANSCTATQTFNVTQPAAIVVTPASQTNISCFGGSNGAASISTPTGGAGGYTYNWTPGNPTGDGTVSVTGLTAGTWTCTVTDANSCTATQTFNVTQPPALVASPAAQTNISCNGGSNGTATVSASGGTPSYTYSWAPSGGTAATATGLGAGTYTVTVTDANGCTTTQTFTITQPPALTASPSAQTNVSCSGGTNGTATVSASGGTPSYTYSWAPSGGTAATASGLGAGTYTVTVTDANSCTATQTFNITSPPALVASPAAQTNIACNGGTNGSATVSASGGTPSYTYSWAPAGGTAATASGLGAGTYTVTVTDANSCTATQTFNITSPPALVASPAAQTNIACNGGTNGTATVSASGGTPSYTYSWAPAGGTAATASGLGAGTYTVTVTDANSCTATQTFTITQPPALTASPSAQTNVSCNGGTNGSATVSASGGTPSYTYLWAPSGGTAATASGLAAGTYTVTVTDANSCTATQTFAVTEPSAITSIQSQTNVSCNGTSTGSATVTPSGGTAPYTYSWSPSGGSAATASSLAAGSYTVTVTDSTGCASTATFNITQPPAIVVSAASQTNVSCNGGTNGAASVNAATGGSGVLTYDWAPGSPAGDGTTSVTGLTAGNWTCNVTDASGCIASQTFTITAPPSLAASAASQTNVSCNNAADGSATVAASGGTGAYTYAWAPSGGTGATASALAAGSYTVTVTDAAGCSTTQAFSITQPAKLSVVTHFVDPTGPGACDGSVAAFVSGGTAPYTFDWSPGGASTAATGSLCEGSYLVLVTDAKGCTAQATAVLTDPIVPAPPDPKIVVTGCDLLGAPCTLTAESISGASQAGWSYSWFINGIGAGSTRTITPALSTLGSYDVTVEALEAGLEGTASTTFTLASPCPAGLLCLQGGRFEVGLTALDPRTGNTATGVPLHRNDLYGLFALPRFTGSEANPEVFIKAIDGRVVNGHFWFFYGGLTDVEYTLTVFDTETHETRKYTKPAGSSAGGFDVGSGVTPEECAGEVDGSPSAAAATGVCVAASDRLCLLGGHFSVRLTARDQRTGATANGVAFSQGDLFGHFALPELTGSPDNPEVFVKMLDGRVVNGHFWIFFAGLTDLEYSLEVTDVTTGVVKSYTKAPGSACGAFDTNGW